MSSWRLPRRHLSPCIATLLMAGLFTLGVEAQSSSNTAVTFLYPQGGERFGEFDVVDVTYNSTFAAAVLTTQCSDGQGSAHTMRYDTNVPTSGFVGVPLNFSSNHTCWFNLGLASKPTQISVDSAVWYVTANTSVTPTTWNATGAFAGASTSVASTGSDGSSTLPSGGIPTSIIVIIVIAVVLAVVGAMAFAGLGIAFCLYRRRQRRNQFRDQVSGFDDGGMINVMGGGRLSVKHTNSESSLSCNTKGSSFRPTTDQPRNLAAHLSEPSFAGTAQSDGSAHMPSRVLTVALNRSDAAKTNTDVKPLAPKWTLGRYDTRPHATSHSSISSPRQSAHANNLPPAPAAASPDQQPSFASHYFNQRTASNSDACELIARDEYQRYGHEQELPTQGQRRHGPEEEKFLMSDMQELKAKAQASRASPG